MTLYICLVSRGPGVPALLQSVGSRSKHCLRSWKAGKDSLLFTGVIAIVPGEHLLFLLIVQTEQSPRWLPVCFASWDAEFS